MRIDWQPFFTCGSLRKMVDSTGAVEGAVVKLTQPTFDGGPYIRQAWFCASRGAFVCSATARVINKSQIDGWALA